MIEVVPTPRGEICVWAEETHAGEANLFAAALEADGRPRGQPSAVVRGVIGWQAAPAANGVGIAVLTRQTTPAAVGKTTTTVSWLRLDPDGRALGAPLIVASTNHRVIDVDVAKVGDGHVLAWTRRGAPEPEVMVASVDADGSSRRRGPSPREVVGARSSMSSGASRVG